MIESVAEEIETYLGLKTKVINNSIHVDTITGLIVFKILFETLMENVYRFIYVYGGRLQEYGIRKRIEESKLTN